MMLIIIVIIIIIIVIIIVVLIVINSYIITKDKDNGNADEKMFKIKIIKNNKREKLQNIFYVNDHS